jgi:hypothetical protein
METAELQVGSVLEFRETPYNQLRHAWEFNLIPAIKVLGEEYEKLEMGKFNQASFNELLSGIKKTETDLISKLEHAREKHGLLFTKESVLSSVPERLKGLKAALVNLNKAFERAGNFGTTGIPVEYNQCAIVDGVPTLIVEKLKAKCSIAIQTEDQLEVWNAALVVQSSWNRFVETAKEKGFDAERFPVYGPNGFFDELPNGYLHLDPLSVTAIKQ